MHHAEDEKNVLTVTSAAEGKEMAEMPIFEKAAREIRDKGFRVHSAEHDADGRDPKEYHTSEHPRNLERRAERAGRIF